MQPYFLPYLGYFQLIDAVDTFVIYDDVDYVNQGWINRNNILVNGQKKLITIPLYKASQNKKINQITILNDVGWRNKMLKTIEMNYKKAFYFDDVYRITQRILFYEDIRLSSFLVNHLQVVAEYMGLETEIITSSAKFKNAELKKGERLADICHQVGDTQYVNPIGGAEIYTKEAFKQLGVDLRFLEMKPVSYLQMKAKEFIPFLSILDVLMMNSPEYIKTVLLKEYNLK